MSRLSASGPHQSSLRRRLRPRDNAATLLRGARACLALLAAAALLALAAPAQAQTEVWTATLTPGDLSSGIRGCSNGVSAARCSNTSFLSEDSFNYDSTDYTITGLFTRGDGDLEILVDADLTTNTLADLTLVVGSTSLVLSGGALSGTVKVIFASSGVSLTVGTDIAVKLTAPLPGTPATGAPTITGTAQVHQTLTAVTTGFMDLDGLTSPTYTYQWIRANGTDADISGAMSSTYTLVAADVGKKVKVKVSFDDDDGNAETLTSAAFPENGTITDPNAAPVLTGVTVTSTPHKTLDTYGAREHIEFSAAFDVPVTVTGAPTFSFVIGTTTKTATWYAGSGTDTLRFSYSVAGGSSGDLDTDGISWAANALALNGGTIARTGSGGAATLTHGAQPALSGHKVSGQTTPITPATITDVAVTSVPRSTASGSTTRDTYGLGETIAITVTVSESVTVEGDPEFLFSLTNMGGAANDVPAMYDRARSSSRAIAFVYTVLAGDRDNNGIWIGNNTRTFRLDVNDRIRTTSRNIDIDRSHSEESTQSGHKVDGSRTPGMATTPPDPTPPLLVSATTTTLTVEWTHPGDGGSPLVRDYVHYRVVGVTDWTNWYAGETPVTRAVITNLQADTAYNVRVHANNAIGNSSWVESATTFRTRANTPATGAPTITGTAQVDKTLTAVTTGIMDADGLTSPTYTYQWIRANGTEADISGANSSTYILVDADLGKTLKVKVTFADDGGHTETLTSEATVAAAAATTPPEVVRVTVDSLGSVVVLVFDEGLDVTAGEALLNSVFSLTADGQALTIPDLSIQGVALVLTVQVGTIKQGQTVVVSYTDPTAGDDTVALQDIAGNDVASFTTGMSGVPAVTNNSTNNAATGEPAITGTAQVGQELTADASPITDTDGLTGVAFTYQWLRVDADGTSNEEDISGEIAETYTLTNDDMGKRIKVKVSFTDELSGLEMRTSAAYPSSGTVTVAAGTNTAPTGADKTVTTGVGTAYTFTADDFGFDDTDTGDTLASVKIVTVPDEGTLALAGTAVALNDVVTKAQIDGDMLTFTPVAGASGDPYTTFTFKVSDGTADSASAYTMTIDVTDAPVTNTAPTAVHNTVTTAEDTAYTFTADDFGFADDDAGDTLASVRIVTVPTAGTLALDGVAITWYAVVTKAQIDGKMLIFTPARDAHGDPYVVFSFKVNDGTVDSTNTYTMTIDVTDAPAPVCTAPSFGDRRKIWTGTVTVGTYRFGGSSLDFYGYNSSAPPSGDLDDQTFTIGSNDYTIVLARVALGGSNSGELLFEMETGQKLTTVEVAALRLHVCHTTVYNFSDATNSRLNSYGWSGSLDWSSPVMTRTVYLSLPANTPATGEPAITGTAQVGQELTATTGTIADDDGLPSSFTYQWVRVDDDGTSNPVDITGEIAETYTLTNDDVGKRIKVKVSFTDELSGVEMRTSAAYPSSGTVTAAAGTPTGAPTITGTAQVGETLTAVTTGIADADGLTSPTYTYQWIRVNGTDADISGANSSTYPLVTADLGKTIKVRVTFVDDAYNTEMLTSAAYPSSGTVTTEVTPPSLSSATVQGMVLTLVYDEPLDPASTPVPLVYILTVTATVGTTTTNTTTNPAAVSVSGSRVTLTLDTAPAAGARVTLVYAGAVVNPVQDVAGNDALPFGVHVMRGNPPPTTNTPPEVANPLADQEVTVDVPFTYVVPADAFTDADGNPLTYTAALSDGGMLPSWLTFDPATRTFTGTPGPGDSGTVRVTVTASDGTATVSDEFALMVTVGNTAPTAGDKTVTTGVGTAYTFTADDFGFDDTDTGDTLASVKIVTVPDEGTLALAGTAVALNDVVTKAQIDGDMLTFTPVAGASGDPYTTFTFKVSDGTADSASAYTMTIDVTAAPVTNTAPTADDNTVTTGVGTAYAFTADDFGFADMDAGDTLASVRIVTLPGAGALTLDGAAVTTDQVIPTADIAASKLIFTPAAGASGDAYASFTFKVSDGTAESATAYTMTVNVGPAMDLDPPGLESAKVDDDTLTLTYDEALDEGSVPAASAFSVSLAGGAGEAPSAVSVDGDTVTLTLATAAAVGQTVTVSYTVPTSNPVQDVAGNNAPAFADRSVTMSPQSALTARFEKMPASHKGPGSRFSFELHFSAQLAHLSYRSVAGPLFTVTNGAVTGARQLTANDNSGWQVDVEPSRHADVTVTLRATTSCNAAHAVCTAANGRLLQGISATVSPSLPALSVFDAEVQEGSGARLDFEVTLSPAAEVRVGVHYETADGTARAGSPDRYPDGSISYRARRDCEAGRHNDDNGDYLPASGLLLFEAGATVKTVSVAVCDDAHDEGSETMYLRLTGLALVEGIWVSSYIADGTATGTITNDDPMPGAWLARFGRTVGSQVLEAVSARVDGRPNSHLRVGGVTVGGVTVGGVSLGGITPLDAAAPLAPRDRLAAHLAQGPDARRPEERALSGRELLLGSSFHLVSQAEAGSAPAFSAWGRVSTGGFQAEVDDLTMDGDVTTGLLGFDAEWKQLLAGLVLAHSEGDGGYNPSGGERGSIESSLNGIYPYARLRLNDRVLLWGLAGAGSGDLTLVWPDEAIDTGLGMRLGAIGVRGTLPAGRGFDLAVKSDALWVRTDSDAAAGLAAATAQVSRLRLILEARRTFALASGAVLAPTAQVGLRHDGGDAETGTGVEVGAGIRYTAGMLTLEGQVRTLLAHEAGGYEEWGASGAIRLSPDASGLGPSLALLPAWGASGSAMARLWSHPEASALVQGSTAAPAPGRLDAEFGWGLPALRGRGVLTPYARVALAEGDNQSWRLGARLALAKSLNLSLEGSRRRTGRDTVHDLTLRASLPW